jgi:hypothetical protein
MVLLLVLYNTQHNNIFSAIYSSRGPTGRSLLFIYKIKTQYCTDSSHVLRFMTKFSMRHDGHDGPVTGAVASLL